MEARFTIPLSSTLKKPLSRVSRRRDVIYSIIVMQYVGRANIGSVQTKGFLMKKFIAAMVLTSSALLFPHSGFAEGSHQSLEYRSAPDLYVVMFRADWCAPCKVVEPKISQALQTLKDPKIEYITIDITNPGLSEIGAHAAFDRNIVAQYNRWLGVTGFAAIIDGDTKQTLGCVNMMYDVPSMTTHIKNLKTFAVSNQKSLDFTCPEPNNPVAIR